MALADVEIVYLKLWRAAQWQTSRTKGSGDLDPVQDEINDLLREVDVERFAGQEQANIQWAN